MLSVLLCLATAPAALMLPPPQDPAALVPADTLIYFGTDSVKAGAVAARKTAMARIFAESEVRGFLHEPVSAAEGVLKAILGQAMAEAGGPGGLGDMIGDDLDVSLYPDASAEPLPIGQAMFAVTHIDLPGGQPGDPPMPDVGLVIGVELLDGEHLAMIQGLWESIPFPSAQATHAGVTIHEKSMGPGTPTLSMSVLGKLAVLSSSPKSIRSVIDLSQGGSGSLADSADYKSLISAAGGAGSGVTTNMVRVPQLVALGRMGLTMGLGQAVMEGEIDQEMVGAILGLFDDLGLDAVQLVGGLSKVGENGRILTTSVARIDANRPGLVGSLIAGGQTVDTAVLGDVPADALSASAAGMGDELAQVYDFAMGALKTFAPDEAGEAEGMIGMVLGGKSLRDDVLANMQRHMVMMTVPGVGFPGTPDTIARVGVERPSDFVDSMRALIGFASSQLEANGFPISLKEEQHAGLAMYEIDLSKTPLAAAGMSPAFAVRDGELVMSNSAPRLRGYLDGALAEGPRLVDDRRFKAFADSLSSNGSIVNVSYSDTASNFSTMYTQVSAVVPMLAMSGVQLPLDFSKLPREQAISQHLDISLAGGYRTADGTFVVRTESSLSMLDLMPLVAVGALLFAGQEMGIEAEAEPMEVDPVQVANDDLRELKASLTIYKIATGGYPERLGQLLEPLDDFPNGAYTSGEGEDGALPVDPRGNAYRYALEANPAKGGRVMPKLWSAGPDGMDEGGNGDDVLKF